MKTKVLNAFFYRVLAKGTEQMSSDKFCDLNCSLVFSTKCDNIASTQLADLSANPSARHILNPEHGNRAYPIVQQKVYLLHEREPRDRS